MPNYGDYGKGSGDRGKSDMQYLEGSPDYYAMMKYKGYSKDMYDGMPSYKPAYASATAEPNTGIQGSADKKSKGNTQNTSTAYPEGKGGNTYKKDYAKMSESQPKEVQKSPKGGGKKYRGGKPKSIKQLREMSAKADGDYKKARKGKVVG